MTEKGLNRLMHGNLNWGRKYNRKSVDVLVGEDGSYRVDPARLPDLRLLTGLQQDPDFASNPKTGNYYLDNRQDPPVLVQCTGKN